MRSFGKPTTTLVTPNFPNEFGALRNSAFLPLIDKLKFRDVYMCKIAPLLKSHGSPSLSATRAVP